MAARTSSDPDFPVLFEPGVPGESHAGQVGHLLAARCAAASVGQTDGCRRDPDPAALEKVFQFPRVVRSIPG